MTNEQIFFYLVLAVIAFIYIRKQILSRGMQHYSAAEITERMKLGSVLLDVRTAGERRSQSISGSIHIPLHELTSRLNDLEKHRSKEIICYCASGSRSVGAAIKLKKAGFKAANLKGGMTSWNFSRR
ncbi:MAG: rhodanese-like domain-containing protein [Ignavibacteriales bacterium]|nr:rhodanese-like domain-containing protein [Ignavibacteriales bacterium]